MKLNFIKTLPIAAAMILAASCGSNDKDPVTPQPTTSKNTSEVTDNGDGTFTVPFTVKVSTGNSLAKKMEYSEGEDGKINIQFVVGTNDDEKLRVSGEGVTGELGLKGEMDDMTMSTIYVFYGDLTLSNGVTKDDFEKGIDLYYEYGEALTEPASSGKSLLDLAKNCNHLYKGTAKSNEDEITLTDQNTYLEIIMSKYQFSLDVTSDESNKSECKLKDGHVWVAVPSGKDLQVGSFLSKNASDVKPSMKHTIKREGLVDLGISGILWADHNVGATNPWEYGDYYAWGETETNKNNFSETNYKYFDGSWMSIKKYCSDPYYWAGESEEPDNIVELKPDDDVVYKTDKALSMPSRLDFQALKDNCYWVWTDKYNDKTFNNKDAAGYIIYKVKDGKGGKNQITFKDPQTRNTVPLIDGYSLSDTHIFIPAAGIFEGEYLNNPGYRGFYWSSSLYTDAPNQARRAYFHSNHLDPQSSALRCYGLSVRAVRRSN